MHTKGSLGNQLRELLPAWGASILLPLLAMLFWRSEDGRHVALWCFFIGCASLVAYAFRPGQWSDHSWSDRMSAIGTALVLGWAVCSLLWLAVVDSHDFVALFLAFQILVPSMCVVPYLALVTRRPFAAVVFSLFLVGSMKLLGCVVVVLVYGWHADAQGYTTMPWTQPNLLVWLFWLNTSLLSLSFYLLGKRRFAKK
jgi:hypothetical protein